MKKILIWAVAIIFFAGITPVFAKDMNGKGPHPSEKAYEHANENAKFKRSEDINNKEVMKATKQADKETEKTKKKTEKEAKKMKKGIGK